MQKTLALGLAVWLNWNTAPAESIECPYFFDADFFGCICSSNETDREVSVRFNCGGSSRQVSGECACNNMAEEGTVKISFPGNIEDGSRICGMAEPWEQDFCEFRMVGEEFKVDEQTGTRKWVVKLNGLAHGDLVYGVAR